MAKYSNSSNYNRTKASKEFQRQNRDACKKGICPMCKIKLIKFMDFGTTHFECPKCSSLFWK